LGFPPAAEIIEHIVDELEQLEAELAHRDLAALAEVDQLAVDAPAGGAPLVLLDERTVVLAEAQVPEAQAIELDDDRLGDGGDGDRRARRGGDIANPEFQRAE